MQVNSTLFSIFIALIFKDLDIPEHTRVSGLLTLPGRQLIVASNPLFLPSPGGLAGGDGSIQRMDLPAVAVGIVPDAGMREHGEHKLALAVCEHLQQLFEILLIESAVIMGAVCTYVWRIHKVEGPLAVVALKKVDAVFALDGHMVEPSAEGLGEIVLGVAEFFGGGSLTVIAEGAVQHGGESQLGTHPYSPSPLHRIEELRMGVDVLGVGMDLPAVQGGIDEILQLAVAALGNFVEVDELGIDIVDHLALTGRDGKENGTSSAEGFGVERVLRDKREDVLQDGLLATVV